MRHSNDGAPSRRTRDVPKPEEYPFGRGGVHRIRENPVNFHDDKTTVGVYRMPRYYTPRRKPD